MRDVFSFMQTIEAEWIPIAAALAVALGALVGVFCVPLRSASRRKKCAPEEVADSPQEKDRAKREEDPACMYRCVKSRY
jgi:hypothetical protein